METDFVPYQASSPPNGKVLVLAPHPDDEVFGCAGAMMHHLAQGDEVNVLILTDGQAAISHPDETAKQAYIQLRQAESRRAAQLLGYNEPIFWQYPDRHLSPDVTLIDSLTTWLEDYQIQTVYAPSVLEIHPDHHALAWATLEAIKKIKYPLQLLMYEIGAPLSPNFLINLTDCWEKKQAAMQCFVSQLAIQHYDRRIQGLNTYRAYTLSPAVKAAEAFYRIDNQHLAKDDPWYFFGYNRQTEYLQTIQSHWQQQQALLTTIYQSRSWRLTAPLRWLNRRLKI